MRRYGERPERGCRWPGGACVRDTEPSSDALWRAGSRRGVDRGAAGPLRHRRTTVESGDIGVEGLTCVLVDEPGRGDVGVAGRVVVVGDPQPVARIGTRVMVEPEVPVAVQDYA